MFVAVGRLLPWIGAILGICFALGDPKVDKLRAELLPACQSCTLFVTSFNKGFERTSRFKFEGGDADWEEKNQGKYASSEVRLVEIQEEMCKEVTRGQQQCHAMIAEQEELLEEWWFSERPLQPDLQQWLCIDKLKRCCPQNTFGADCSPCPGGTERPCNGRGKCAGAGTRKGNGECKCDKGYSGALCDECSVGFYSANDPQPETVQCAECHKACQGHCREGGPKGCEVCKDGWLYHSELGCQDVDECVTGTRCRDNQFCANTEGSFMCVDCYKSCATCVGDGPDMCGVCAEGYVQEDGLCVDVDTWMRNAHTRYARYLTYAGLCVATFIILRKRPLVAGVIGVAVAVYVGVSEYTVTKTGMYEIQARTTEQQ